MRRIIRIPIEVGVALVEIFSRILNAVLLGGSMQQTTSARAYLESRKSTRWDVFRRFINFLFLFSDDHCLRAWEAEVRRARRTLEINEAL